MESNKPKREPTYRVQISDGKGYAIVDMADAHLVSQHRWHFAGKHAKYVETTLCKGVSVSIQRVIMGAGPGDIVDHINGNPLDNRRQNLRFASVSQNSANRKNTASSTGFRGVVFHPQRKRYQSRLNCEGASFRGPYRQTAEQAAMDWDAMARGLFGEFATYNFPRPGERRVIPVVDRRPLSETRA